MELKWRAGEPVLFHKDVMPFSFLFLIVITMGGWDFQSPPIGKARRAPSIAAVISDMIQG